MVQKFFKADKNYLLEEAQLRLAPALLNDLFELVREAYFLRFNPLGLEDDTIKKIKHAQPDLAALNDFYLTLCGIYRLKYGDNQLEFMWDGRSHVEKYADDWKATFNQWVRVLCADRSFLKSVIMHTVFLSGEHHLRLAQGRMNAFVRNQFDVRVSRRKGNFNMRAAV